jgi:hypothetical protein
MRCDYIDRQKCCWDGYAVVYHSDDGQEKHSFAMVRSQFGSTTFDQRQIWVEWEYLQLYVVEIVRHLK